MGLEKGNQTKSKLEWLWWLLVLVLAALVVAAAVITLLHHFKHPKPSGGGVPSRPGPIVAEYAKALEIAMHFFDVQKCILNLFNYVCLL